MDSAEPREYDTSPIPWHSAAAKRGVNAEPNGLRSFAIATA
jgi:hypothetical protein